MNYKDSFNTIHTLLLHHNYESALNEVENVLHYNSKDFYAQTLNKKIRQLLETTDEKTRYTSYTVRTLNHALQQICKMALNRHASQSYSPNIKYIREHYRKQALQEKSNEWLRHARQLSHLRQYKQALEEIQRALILCPDNTEAKEFEKELQKQINNNDSSPIPISNTIESSESSFNESEIQHKPTLSTVDKIIACISYAEYHRSNGDYEQSLSYINEGLQYDSDNEVLLRLKQEIENERTSKPVSEIQ